MGVDANLDGPADREREQSRTSHAARLGIAMWIAAMVAGFTGLVKHATTPGDAGAGPASWPAATTLARSGEGPALLVFVHPKCPCTRATVEELARVLESAPSPLDLQMVVFEPATPARDWADTPALALARTLPGVRIVRDRGGVQARLFGALTSGHTLLFDRAGRRVFSGGITGSRGHVGDNPGRALLIGTLAGLRAGDRTPVFGCPIVNRVQS